MFLYFIQAGGAAGPVKIGHSRNVAKRLEQLQTGNPAPLRLVAACPLEDAAERERDLHWFLSDDRLEGEWFAASELLRNIIVTTLVASIGIVEYAHRFPDGVTL